MTLLFLFSIHAHQKKKIKINNLCQEDNAYTSFANP